MVAQRQLYIYMNGRWVGTLAKGHGGTLRFSYDAQWLKWDKARPLSVTLPLTSPTFSGDAVEMWFENLLPDRPGVKEQLQRRFKTRGSDAFSLLAHIGGDCIGAVQITPEKHQIEKQRAIEAAPLSHQNIAQLLRDAESTPLGLTPDRDFRLSLAGAQQKTALLWHNNQWCLPQGTTPTSHIFKLPIGRLETGNIDLTDSNENEWLCQQLLSAMDIPVAHTEICTFERQKALVVERFDRRLSTDKSWIVREPQEDLCQALGVPSSLKYESDGGPSIVQCMNLLRGSSHAVTDRRRFMEAILVFWALGAIDGHGKNFSLFIRPQGRFYMTPLYDVMSVYPLMASRQLDKQRASMAMAMMGKNRHYKWNEIQPRHFLSTAKACGFPADEMLALMQSLPKRVDHAVAEVSMRLPSNFPSHVSEPIFDGLRKSASKFTE